VSLAQVQGFVAIAANGRVRHAARKLARAQPWLSQQIKNLEDELGARLFVRSRFGMELSREGSVLLPHARAILESVAEAESAVRDARTNDVGAVDLLQLERFVAVAESGGVGRAARRLHVAQPAVTRQILELERALGAQLFLRTPSGMRLSRAGEKLEPHARGVVRRMREAHAAVADAVRGRRPA
jgi:DNA-binding transcriptional LysR family regulator